MEKKTPFTVLISSVGRRSQLIECFRRTFAELDIEGHVLGIDLQPALSPAAHLVDECFAVPRCTDPGYLDEVLRLCVERQVALIVPTIDTELPIYAAERQTFASRGVDIAVSGPDTVDIACDKVRTHEFLTSHSIPTVRQTNAAGLLSCPQGWQFPLILKPRRGSASIGVVKVDSDVILRALLSNNQDSVVQEFARGYECTVNLFVDANGRCICAVPHRRIEVRGGEVSKAVIVREPRVIAIALRVAEALPRAYGPLNMQCFVDGETVVVTEINARFGGGYPLAFEAGANFPLWLLQRRLDRELPDWYDGWKDNLTMLRFDTAVFV
jgi:carbamoyl-phosphate synthase large subunit